MQRLGRSAGNVRSRLWKESSPKKPHWKCCSRVCAFAPAPQHLRSRKPVVLVRADLEGGWRQPRACQFSLYFQNTIAINPRPEKAPLRPTRTVNGALE
jgi:hypothetical protein